MDNEDVKAPADFLLRWGTRKRLRCVKVRSPAAARPRRTAASRSCREGSSSPEKEENRRIANGKSACPDEGGGDQKGRALPKFFISLSSKEKEEDFMAMKGCKLPQRPKKRAKCIQKIILLVTPGSWLSDLSQERYEVREKKSSRKRRRGLKAMSMESDSE